MAFSSCTTNYDRLTSTFTIRILGKITEQDIITCFQDYEKTVVENFGGKKFNVIINVDEKAHSSIAVLRLIRSSLENQKYRDYIANIVAVNENPLTVAMRNSYAASRRLPFFVDEGEAKQYLSRRMQENG